MIKVFLILALILTRLVGINWGYPYLFHPDENNITASVLQLNCSHFSVFNLKECFNPHFFAYGHLYSYLGRTLLPLVSLIVSSGQYTPLAGSLSLRLISSISSVLTGLVLYLFFKREFKRESLALIGLFLYIFTPVFIQLAHFGTTESILIFLFTLSLYFRRNFYLTGFLIGLSSAIKISSITLMIIPLVQMLVTFKRSGIVLGIKHLFWAGFISLTVFLLFTPHYWLNFPSFLSSFIYESSVASGKLPVFYTGQFRDALPFIYETVHVFPYAVGLPVLLMAVIGLLLSLRYRRFELLFIFLVLFSYQTLLYAKWTRFYIYLYPLFIYFSLYFVARLLRFGSIYVKLLVLAILICHSFLGLAFFSIYLKPDPRIEAGRFMKSKVNSQTRVVSESANVVDIPNLNLSVNHHNYFLYDIQTNLILRKSVFDSLDKAEYVVVDSRRVFHNYSCFWFENRFLKYLPCRAEQDFPDINRYSRELLNSQKFKRIKTESNYPSIGSFEWMDENAEETITVFDHPVVRIYQRNSGFLEK